MILTHRWKKRSEAGGGGGWGGGAHLAHAREVLLDIHAQLCGIVEASDTKREVRVGATGAAHTQHTAHRGRGGWETVKIVASSHPNQLKGGERKQTFSQQQTHAKNGYLLQ